jgi:hypothetical protein
MSGCGTSLKGRAIFEVYESGVNVHDYDGWVKNYIRVQQSLAEGQCTPEQADWFGATFYIKEAGDTALNYVRLHALPEGDGKTHVCWMTWDYYEDEERAYEDQSGEPLMFSFDPREGLTRLMLTIVPRESADEPMPEGWNGTWIFDEACPLWGVPEPRGMWEWVDSHTISKNFSGDVLVTLYGEETGVDEPIATREIVVRRRDA